MAENLEISKVAKLVSSLAASTAWRRAVLSAAMMDRKLERQLDVIQVVM